MKYELIIIGAGPAGLTASIYASRYKISHLLIGKDLGGAMALAWAVENYPGFEKISGMELTKKMVDQAKRLGAEIKLSEVTKLTELTKGIFTVKTADNQIYQAKTLIIATGTRRRELGVPGEREYLGKGVSYCATCLPTDEEIVANDSLVSIGKIGIAQRVLTADGSFKDIVQIMSRAYAGKLVEIQTKFFTEPVKLTANHPVLSTRIERNYYKKTLRIKDPVWKRAEELKVDDVLLYPIIKKTEDKDKIRFSEVLGVEVVNGKAKNNQETHSSHRLSDEIPLNEEFLRLAGYYLAEGSVDSHGINFYFSKNEQELIKDVSSLIEKLFSLKPNIKIEGGVARISVFSKLIKNLFLILFGKYAPNKKIPHWMLFLPLEKQKELIRGFYRGDGCLREKDFCFVTTSRTLAYQMRDILLRFGVIPAINKRPKAKLNNTPGEIGGRKIRFNFDKYHLNAGGASLKKMSEILGVTHPLLKKRKRFCRHAWIDNQYVYLPIRKIKKEDYQGRVYNLAVEGNNTYIAKNFIVHNCDAPFFKNKVVAVVGGANAAAQAAVYLAEFASKVYVIYRRKPLRAEPVWKERAEGNPKIEIIYETNVRQILGKSEFANLKSQMSNLEGVGGVELDKPYRGSKFLAVEGVFVEIGGVPGTELAKRLGVEVDEKGYIKVNNQMETNIPGVFAAGDIANASGELQQIVTACSEGAIAATSVYRYLKNWSNWTDLRVEKTREIC